MSIIGKNNAIISVGISCQTAIQINKNAGMISKILGEKLEVHRFHFDFAICNPCHIGFNLKSLMPVPEEPQELMHCSPKFHAPLWFERGKIFYFHDFHDNGNPLDVEGNFQGSCARLNQIRERFIDLRNVKNRYFFISNTQNDVEWHKIHSDIHGIDYTITKSSLQSIQDGLDGLFPGDNKLIVVAYEDRISAAAMAAPWKTIIMDQDSSPYEGDDAAWRQIFQDTLNQNRGRCWSFLAGI